MNQEERSRIGEMWLAVASMFGRDIQKQAMTLMLNAVSDLDYGDVMRALDEWTRSSKNKIHPMPGDIRSIIQPKIEAKDQARELSSLLIDSVSKFGYMQSQEARVYMGEIAWNVVNRYGGWVSICERLGVDLDVQTFQAQVRDLIESKIKIEQQSSRNERLEISDKKVKLLSEDL